jgi:transcriptional regulator with XRE-family HTH domain
MSCHYGETHMGLHIGNSYRPARVDWMKTRGQRIRAMRKALGMNQVELADKLGVDQSTVSDIENGKGFSSDLLMKLTEALGGTAALIMTGHDDAVWPFPRLPIERFLALDQENRAYVEGKLEAAIESFEVKESPQPKPRPRTVEATGYNIQQKQRRKA